jgi:hypothetical protein
MEDANTAGAVYNHSPEVIASFLDGLEIVPPGVVLAHAWRGGMPDPDLRPAGAAYMHAAAGRKA